MDEPVAVKLAIAPEPAYIWVVRAVGALVIVTGCVIVTLDVKVHPLELMVQV